MTRTANARVAGAAFLVYIAAGIGSMVLAGRARGTGDTAARLASVATHVSDMRLAAVLNIVGALCAIALAVTLYALTRDVDRDVAAMGFACRLAEGVVGVVPASTLGWLWLATGGATVGTAQAEAIARLLSQLGAWHGATAAFLFALGSTAFAWLLVRGALVPRWLGVLGLVASVLLVPALPLDLLDLVPASVMWALWMPMLAFELVFAGWLLVRGLAAPGAGRSVNATA